MKVAVIGVGRMGLLHAKLLRQMPEVKKLLIVDLDDARAQTVADQLEGEAVADPIDAIERTDVAVIAVPPDAHANLVRAAVDRGRPVLCEKPLASDLREAVDLAAYVESAGVPVHVGFQRRFDPAIAAARRLVASGSLGMIHLIRLDSTEPKIARSNRTNLFRNTAIHDFDLTRWLSDCEALSVHVEGSDRDGGPFDRRRDPDSIVLAIRLSDGSLCSITTSRLSPHGYDVRAELLGSRDHVSVGWTERTPVRSLEAGVHAGLPNVWRSWQERFKEAYRLELRAFLAADRGAIDVAATVRDGVEAQRIAEAAQRSLIEGQTVFL
jgi:myo-inositol 2-dehydrogenase / D-chiro-inositol 1-dehydrogenase